MRGHDKQSVQSALDYFDRALKAGAADASSRMYNFNKENFWTQKALTAAQAAEQINDKLPEVHSALGSAYRATGKYAEAITELKRVFHWHPIRMKLTAARSRLWASGDYAHAIGAFQKAVDLNPYFWSNQNSLGDAYVQLADYPKALQAFQRALVHLPHPLFVFNKSLQQLLIKGTCGCQPSTPEPQPQIRE
jgi:tetratricopeptide (TPR) repeat protein